MASTYELIATTTLPSAANQITFTAIPSTYTDIILVFNGDLDSITGASVRVGNGSIDTTSNYSLTRIWGKTDGTYGSSRETTADQIRWDYWAAGNGNRRTAIFQFQNYSNTTTNKSVLIRTAIPSTEVLATVGMWRSTSAINQIRLMLSGGSQNYIAGSIATLYGIKAA